MWQVVTIQTKLIITLAAFFVIFSGVILVPFLPAFAWALALSVVSYPSYMRLVRWTGHRGFAAGAFVTLFSLCAFGPLVWVGERLCVAAVDGAHTLLPMLERREWESHLAVHPRLIESLTWLEQNIRLHGTAAAVVAQAREAVPRFAAWSVWAVLQALLILFASFFLLRDGPRLLLVAERLLPLNAAETRWLLQRLSDTIHATLFGMIAVALLQGTLGGLMFWWLGLPAPLIWGAVMTLLATVPYLGTFIVWIPVAGFFAAQGRWGDASLLVLWGALVIGLSDNLLYPMLVGKRLHYHTLVVFFFLLGGIVVLGTSGVVLGPMTLVVSEGLLKAARHRLSGPGLSAVGRAGGS
jgi:predicted PurR-regulated permease PerM